MKTSRHSSPTVNAGSMADIAFLLLIFFLVTTTISADKGIKRKLSEICPPGAECNTSIIERNILRISINKNDQLLIEDEVVSIQNLKGIAKAFIDNNGDSSCSYCNGLKKVSSSDNPSEAVISLSTDKQTTYETYILVQDLLTQDYCELREGYAMNVLKRKSQNLSEDDLKKIKKAYPFILSEAETKE